MWPWSEVAGHDLWSAWPGLFLRDSTTLEGIFGKIGSSGLSQHGEEMTDLLQLRLGLLLLVAKMPSRRRLQVDSKVRPCVG